MIDRMNHKCLPLVSVVMPVFNGENYLGEAIDSILTQTFTDFELIIVDDGSADGSADIMDSYAQGDSRVRLLRHAVNQGQAKALNTGLAASRGEFVATMDCDDVSKPERLQSQVDFLRAHPKVGAVGVNLKVYDHDMLEMLYAPRLPKQHALIVLNAFIGDIFLGATIMFRREFAPAVGGTMPEDWPQPDNFEPRLRVLTDARFACLEQDLYAYRRHPNVQEKKPGSALHDNFSAFQRRSLQELWSEAPNESLQRFALLHRKPKLSWIERRKTKRDLMRLAKSLVTAEWVEPGDEDLLIAAIDQLLEEASPQLWQKFCHWRRYRLPGLFPDRFGLYK